MCSMAECLHAITIIYLFLPLLTADLRAGLWLSSFGPQSWVMGRAMTLLSKWRIQPGQS